MMYQCRWCGVWSKHRMFCCADHEQEYQDEMVLANKRESSRIPDNPMSSETLLGADRDGGMGERRYVTRLKQEA